MQNMHVWELHHFFIFKKYHAMIFSFSRQILRIFMPPQPMLHQNDYVFALSVAASVFRRVKYISFLSQEY